MSRLREEQTAAMSRLREEQTAAMSRLREEQTAAMSRLREEQTAAMSRLREEQTAMPPEVHEVVGGRSYTRHGERRRRRDGQHAIHPYRRLAARNDPALPQRRCA